MAAKSQRRQQLQPRRPRQVTLRDSLSNECRAHLLLNPAGSLYRATISVLSGYSSSRAFSTFLELMRAERKKGRGVEEKKFRAFNHAFANHARCYLCTFVVEFHVMRFHDGSQDWLIDLSPRSSSRGELLQIVRSLSVISTEPRWTFKLRISRRIVCRETRSQLDPSAVNYISRFSNFLRYQQSLISSIN